MKDRLHKLLFETDGIELLNLNVKVNPEFQGREQDLREAMADIIEDVREGRTVASSRFAETGVEKMNVKDFVRKRAK